MIERIAQPVCMDLNIHSIRRISRNSSGKYIIHTDAGDICVEELPLSVLNAIIQLSLEQKEGTEE